MAGDQADGTARWVARLLDAGSVLPFGRSGLGTVDDRPLAVLVLPDDDGDAALAVLRRVETVGCPVVVVLTDGCDALPPGLLAAQAGLSGVVPQLAVVAGAVSREAVLAAALADFAVLTEPASLLLTAVADTETATGERWSTADLGGARVHATLTGVAHHVADDDDTALDWVRDLLGFLPANSLDEPEQNDVDVDDDDDDGGYLPVGAAFAPAVACGFLRVDGSAVGVVSSGPEADGCLGPDAADKAARFVRTCDAFSVPLLTLLDSPGLVSGAAAEQTRLARALAGLAYAYAEASVPQLTAATARTSPLVRRLFGGDSPVGPDLGWVWDGDTPPDPADPGAFAERTARALRVLRTKRVPAPLRKHGNIPR